MYDYIIFVQAVTQAVVHNIYQCHNYYAPAGIRFFF